ncbi:hypothetical protein FI667_g15096, partial [Globisporangium splendens]
MIPNVHMHSAAAMTFPPTVKDAAGHNAATSSLQRAKKATYKNIERRRAQNRVNAQKSYYRKLRTLETLRAEVVSLEKILEAKKEDQSAVSQDMDKLYAMFNNTSMPVTSDAQANYRVQLQELQAAHRELEQERLALQELLDVHINFQHHVQEQWLQDAADHESCPSMNEFIDVRPSTLQVEALWWVWPRET